MLSQAEGRLETCGGKSARETASAAVGRAKSAKVRIVAVVIVVLRSGVVSGVLVRSMQKKEGRGFNVSRVAGKVSACCKPVGYRRVNMSLLFRMLHADATQSLFAFRFPMLHSLLPSKRVKLQLLLSLHNVAHQIRLLMFSFLPSLK